MNKFNQILAEMNPDIKKTDEGAFYLQGAIEALVLCGEITEEQANALCEQYGPAELELPWGGCAKQN